MFIRYLLLRNPRQLLLIIFKNYTLCYNKSKIEQFRNKAAEFVKLLKIPDTAMLVEDIPFKQNM